MTEQEIEKEITKLMIHLCMMKFSGVPNADIPEFINAIDWSIEDYAEIADHERRFKTIKHDAIDYVKDKTSGGTDA